MSHPDHQPLPRSVFFGLCALGLLGLGLVYFASHLP